MSGTSNPTVDDAPIASSKDPTVAVKAATRPDIELRGDRLRHSLKPGLAACWGSVTRLKDRTVIKGSSSGIGADLTRFVMQDDHVRVLVADTAGERAKSAWKSASRLGACGLALVAWSQNPARLAVRQVDFSDERNEGLSRGVLQLEQENIRGR